MLEECLDILLDTTKDSLRILPFLFVTYLIMEYIGHKSNTKMQSMIKKAGKYGPALGGVLGAFINYVITKKSKNATNKMDFRELLDILAPSMILGQALGRWGNFVNQELYGAEITNPKFQCFPFAVQIDVHPVYENGVFVTNLYDHWFQATFFYEMVLNLIGFAIIVIIGRKCKKNLAPLTFYLTWYLAVRSVMESLRTDAVVSNGIHVGVVGCAIGAAISFIIFVLILTNVIHTGVPKYIVDSTPIEPDEE